MKIGNMVRKNIKGLAAYSPGLFKAKYKMDANENPYDLPASVKKTILTGMQKIQFNRYPDSYAKELRNKIARKNRVKPENIVFGNGSDEIINYLLQVFCGPGEAIIVPTPTFEMYKIGGIINGNKVIEVPLDGNFDIDSGRIIKLANKSKAKIIFIASPNNPTGNCFSKEKILDIIESTNSLVVVDEAYLEFSGCTLINYLKKNKNLIILRTFSKLYSAAIRLGYMIADKKIIEAINKVRLPYNINSFSQGAALEILKLGSYIKSRAGLIISERKKIYAALKDKYRIVKSNSNFFFIKLNKGTEESKKYFQKNSFSIRIFRSGPAKGWMRLTIGTPEENKAVIKLLLRGAK